MGWMAQRRSRESAQPSVRPSAPMLLPGVYCRRRRRQSAAGGLELITAGNQAGCKGVYNNGSKFQAQVWEGGRPRCIAHCATITRVKL